MIRKMLSRIRLFIDLINGRAEVSSINVVKAAIRWRHAGENNPSFEGSVADFKEAELNLASTVIEFEKRYGSL